MEKKVLLVFISALFLVALISVVSAQEYALDVKIEKQTYSSEENVSYKVILLKGGVEWNEKVSVTISDVADIEKTILSIDPNKDQEFFIQKSFTSGYWKIEATYLNKSVKRFFSIGQREEAEFSIEGNKLIVRNVGNVPYTKEIQILIGEKVITQTQNIEIGGYKEIKLVAPDGNYNVQVTDGEKTISKADIYLTGTGRVIGALDEDLVENQPILGAARDPDEEDISTPSNSYFGFIMIGAIFGLFALLTLEKYIIRKRGNMAQQTLNMNN